MLFIGILHLIKIILNKIQFVQFTSPNITILLCLQITNIDCKNINVDFLIVFPIVLSCIKNNDL